MAVSEPDGTPPAPAVLTRAAGRRSVGWSALSVGGRQALQLVFSISLARILGPDQFGVVNLATVYVVLTMILLDQGMSSALIQRKELDGRLPGATATLNLLTGVLLMLLTWACAGWLAGFYRSEEFGTLLRWLAPCLLVKALAITPRALLARRLHFKPVALADTVGAAVGCACGLAAAFGGLGVMSLAVQVVSTDLVVAAILLAAARGPVPNLALRRIRTILPFTVRVFLTSCIAFIPRNIDNILIGRYLGIAPLALYGIGYRMLGIPVQLLGQTTRRVLFPAFSRMAGDRAQARSTLLTATMWLALATVPLMSLMAVSAWQFVPLVFGDAYAAAAPIVAVLALSGARETIFYPTPALMTGFGRADLALRFEWLSSAVQVAAIVIGLQFGILGVALCYAAAGVLLVPVLLWVQHSLAGVRPSAFARRLGPGVHAAAWGSLAYWALTLAGLSDLVTFLLGSVSFALAALLVLLLAHRRLVIEALSLLPGGSRGRHRGSIPDATA